MMFIKPKIIIVDENDNEIGSAYRETIVLNDPRIYRVSALWISNSRGEVLLARRAFTKTRCPGKWGGAVNGTVEVGETYEKNVQKEAKEELGLTEIQPIKGPKVLISQPYNFFGQWFLLETDKSIDDFKIQKNEVEQISWFHKNKLERMLLKYPELFLPSLKESFDLLAKRPVQTA